jgi:hypothetical protein
MDLMQTQLDPIFDHHPLAMILVPEIPQSPIANRSALKTLGVPVGTGLPRL